MSERSKMSTPEADEEGWVEEKRASGRMRRKRLTRTLVKAVIHSMTATQ